jgi:hypothetical protein
MVTQEIANPYLELLGIPESELPANKYRLLGIPLFTSNDNVIRNAAARQMQFLRRVGGDKYLDDVQQILNEVAEARILLLDSEKRESYDAEIRRQADGSAAATPHSREKGLAVSLIALNGANVGAEFEFTNQIRLGNSDECQIELDGINTEFLIHRQNNQWVIESPLATFAVNDSLVEDRAFLKTGDIVRFRLDGQCFQFQIFSHQEEVGKWLENFPHCRIDPPQIKFASALATGSQQETASASRNGKAKAAQETRTPKFVKKKSGGFDWAFGLFWLGVGMAITALVLAIWFNKS